MSFAKEKLGLVVAVLLGKNAIQALGATDEQAVSCRSGVVREYQAIFCDANDLKRYWDCPIASHQQVLMVGHRLTSSSQQWFFSQQVFSTEKRGAPRRWGGQLQGGYTLGTWEVLISCSRLHIPRPHGSTWSSTVSWQAHRRLNFAWQALGYAHRWSMGWFVGNAGTLEAAVALDRHHWKGSLKFYPGRGKGFVQAKNRLQSLAHLAGLTSQAGGNGRNRTAQIAPSENNELGVVWSSPSVNGDADTQSVISGRTGTLSTVGSVDSQTLLEAIEQLGDVREVSRVMADIIGQARQGMGRASVVSAVRDFFSWGLASSRNSQTSLEPDVDTQRTGLYSAWVSLEGFPVLNLQSPNASGYSGNLLRGPMAEKLLCPITANHQPTMQNLHRGLVLNNTKTSITSGEHGRIPANPNLMGENAEARCIVLCLQNEDVHRKRTISGELSIAGARAHVVLVAQHPLRIDDLVLDNVASLTLLNGGLTQEAPGRTRPSPGLAPLQSKMPMQLSGALEFGSKGVRSKHAAQRPPIYWVAPRCRIEGELAASRIYGAWGSRQGVVDWFSEDDHFAFISLDGSPDIEDSLHIGPQSGCRADVLTLVGNGVSTQLKVDPGLVLQTGHELTAQGSLHLASPALSIQPNARFVVKQCCRVTQSCEVECLGTFEAETLVISEGIKVSWKGEPHAFQGVKRLVLEKNAEVNCQGDTVFGMGAKVIEIGPNAQLRLNDQPASVGSPLDETPPTLRCRSQRQAWKIQGGVNLEGEDFRFESLAVDPNGRMNFSESEVVCMGERMRLGAGAQLQAAQLSLQITDEITSDAGSDWRVRVGLSVDWRKQEGIASPGIFSHAGKLETPKLEFFGQGSLKANAAGSIVVTDFQLHQGSRLRFEAVALQAQTVSLRGEVKTVDTTFCASESFHLGDPEGKVGVRCDALSQTDAPSWFSIRSPTVVLCPNSYVTCGTLEVAGYAPKSRSQRLCTAGRVDCQVACIAAVQWDQTGKFSELGDAPSHWKAVYHFRQYIDPKYLEEPELILYGNHWGFTGNSFRNEAGRIVWQGDQAALEVQAFHNQGALVSPGSVFLHLACDQITGSSFAGEERIADLNVTGSQLVCFDQLRLLATWADHLQLTLNGLQASLSEAITLPTRLTLQFGSHSYAHQANLTAYGIAVVSDQMITLKEGCALKAKLSPGEEVSGCIALRANAITLGSESILAAENKIQLEADQHLEGNHTTIAAFRGIEVKASEVKLQNQCDVCVGMDANGEGADLWRLELDAQTVTLQDSTLRNTNGPLNLKIDKSLNCCNSHLFGKESLLLSLVHPYLSLQQSEICSLGEVKLKCDRGMTSQDTLEGRTTTFEGINLFAKNHLVVRYPLVAWRLQNCTVKSLDRVDVQASQLDIADSEILGRHVQISADQGIRNHQSILAEVSVILESKTHIENLRCGQITSNGLIRLVAPKIVNDSERDSLNGAAIRSVGEVRDGTCGGIQIFTDCLQNLDAAKILTQEAVSSDHIESPDRFTSRDVLLLPYATPDRITSILEYLQRENDHPLVLDFLRALTTDDLLGQEISASILNRAGLIYAGGQLIAIAKEWINQVPDFEIESVSEKLKEQTYYEYEKDGKTDYAFPTEPFQADCTISQKWHPEYNGCIGKLFKYVCNSDGSLARKETINDPSGLEVFRDGLLADVVRDFRIVTKTYYRPTRQLFSSGFVIFGGAQGVWIKTRCPLEGLATGPLGCSKSNFFDFTDQNHTKKVWVLKQDPNTSTTDAQRAYLRQTFVPVPCVVKLFNVVSMAHAGLCVVGGAASSGALPTLVQVGASLARNPLVQYEVKIQLLRLQAVAMPYFLGGMLAVSIGLEVFNGLKKVKNWFSGSQQPTDTVQVSAGSSTDPVQVDRVGEEANLPDVKSLDSVWNDSDLRVPRVHLPTAEQMQRTYAEYLTSLRVLQELVALRI